MLTFSDISDIALVSWNEVVKKQSTCIYNLHHSMQYYLIAQKKVNKL